MIESRKLLGCEPRILYTVVLILIIGILLSGCSARLKNSSLLEGPKAGDTPLRGSWSIESVHGNSTEGFSQIESIHELLGEKVLFSENFVRIGNYRIENPSYKSKRVDAEKYLLFNHLELEEGVSLGMGEITVITIENEDRMLGDFIGLEEGEGILFIENFSLKIRFLSEEVAEDSTRTTPLNSENNGIFFGNRENGTGKSGVLFGLRNDSEGTGGDPLSSYRTLWISMDNKVLREVREKKYLFYPRRDGFWKLNMGNGEITTSPVFSTELSSSTPFLKKSENSPKNVAIDFICNDYIAVRYRIENEKKELRRVVEINRLPDLSGISASELLGPLGIKNIQEGILKEMTSHGVISGQADSGDESLMNFGVTRKMGHWFLTGRFNYQVDERDFSSDYPLNMIPPTNLVFFDEAKVDWTDIKDRVPDALDAFGSPNGDFCIIRTKKTLYLYDIQNRKLSPSPKHKITIGENEKPIMAEWATGKYLDLWEQAFKAAE